MTSPRIAFAGAGALGSVIGGLMTEAGHDVTLVDQWPEHVEAIKKHGLRVTTRDGEHAVNAKALQIHELQSVDEPFDIVFIAVKSYDTDWAVRLMLPYSHAETRFLSIQNGINDDRVIAAAGRERTLGFITTIAAGLYDPGHAMRTDDTEKMAYTIGELDGADTPRAREVIELASAAGKTKFTDNLMGERWGKLASNCALNATAGITGYGTADVIYNEDSRKVGVQCAAEAIRVGRALGY
ncbi:MAG: ketopantoate reductase family protein, partial [Chloroflexota bacterium]